MIVSTLAIPEASIFAAAPRMAFSVVTCVMRMSGTCSPSDSVPQAESSSSNATGETCSSSVPASSPDVPFCTSSTMEMPYLARIPETFASTPALSAADRRR